MHQKAPNASSVRGFSGLKGCNDVMRSDGSGQDFQNRFPMINVETLATRDF